MNKLQNSPFLCSTIALLSLFLFSVGVEAQSLLWKIDGGMLNSPSYIYGTIHIKDKRIFQYDNSVNEAMESCSAYAMEVDLNEDNMACFAKCVLLPEGKTLQDIFSPEDYMLVKGIIEKETGMAMSMFDRMKPFALLSLGLDSQIAGDTELTIDEFFYRQAQKEGKRILGLETLEEQLKMLEKIPLDYITDYFKNFHKGAEDLEEIILLYINADLDHLLLLMQKDKAMASLEKQLITKRNKKMVRGIIPLITGETAFIAVGAGHLPGKKGIIKLLEKRGYAVTPVMRESQASEK